MSSPSLPPMLVKYKAAGAERQPSWRYEDLDADGIQVSYRQPGVTSPAGELSVDLGSLYVTLTHLNIAGCEVATDRPGTLSLKFDLTTGRGDHICLRLTDRLAEQLADALAAQLRRARPVR